MTAQACDYVWYNGKKYTLIDCEKKKSLINAAEFGLEKVEICSTACYRGYTAEYFIENDYIYGVKQTTSILRSEEKVTFRTIESEKLYLNYTGSIVIAYSRRNSCNFADFLDGYLNHDEAFELYFIDGMLVEERSLKDAIIEWKRIINNGTMKKGDRYSQWAFDKQREIAYKYLKYEYGMGYKWR